MFNSKELKILKHPILTFNQYFNFNYQTESYQKILFKKYIQLRDEGYSKKSIIPRINEYLQNMHRNVYLNWYEATNFNNLQFNLSLKQNRKYVKFLIQDLFYSTVIHKKIIKPYPFLDDHTFLVAELCFLGENINDGVKTQIKFIRFNEDMLQTIYSETMNCVHVVIDRVATADFFEQMGNRERNIEKLKHYEKQNLTSEGLRNEISLAPSESFKALCIYVGGIAEAGMDAFFLSRELADSVSGGFTIGKQIFRMILSSMKEFQEKSNFILEYLEYCNKICRYENKLHKESMLANIYFLWDSVVGMSEQNKFYKIIVNYAEDLGITKMELLK